VADPLQESDDDPDCLWEAIEGTVKGVAKKILGKNEKLKSKPWFDEECELWFERRKKARLENLSNTDNEVEEICQQVERQTREIYRGT